MKYLFDSIIYLTCEFYGQLLDEVEISNLAEEK